MKLRRKSMPHLRNVFNMRLGDGSSSSSSVAKSASSASSSTYPVMNFNNFIHTPPISSSNGNYFNNERDGKKYKLRLKFDGACALEVVRLNGGHFQNLTHLDISGNSAEKLDLRSLSRLEWLCCANNNLEVLSLSGSSLTYLDCSNNNLHSISVDPVPNNLTTLQISYNVIEDLPTWSWMVPELFVIFASHNRIRQLDCKFQNCLNNLPIRELYIHCNQIEFVSKDFIQRATKLKVLNLSQNHIEYMPNFGKKCGIQELSLSRNRLQDTDDKDALEFLIDCSHLKRLFLGFNKIEHLSERCLSGWKNMEELILCGNRIRHLPSKISSLGNLRVLRVHSNRLETVPALNKMPALKVVDLSHNNLRKINIENLISGGNLTYLDISCNERLTVNPDKLHSQKRPMNLVEVSNPRKKLPSGMKSNDSKQFPANPPWEIGFSELPDRNLTLSVTQYRDINLSFGKEALFGIFDGGDGNPAPKYIPKCIAKIYAEEKNINETNNVSLKYTLLNAMKNVRQLGSSKPIQGLVCLLSMVEEVSGTTRFCIDLAMIGGIRCLLVESGRKITRLTDMIEEGCEVTRSSSPTCSDSHSSLDSEESCKNNLNGNIPDPRLFSFPLTTKAEYLVIANQSLWNHMNEDEIISEIEANKNKKTVLVAKKLADLAQTHSCKACLSVIIVRFKWHFTTQTKHSDNQQQKITELGPLSYCSSEYSSDLSNPPVTTPDSAIDSDRSSRTSSSSSPCDTVNTRTNVIKRQQRNTSAKSVVQRNNSLSDDNESVANTSISQMSVEQFKCWEYMLEQNTKLLFKKELDSLSKGVFQRNQKLRKSVHFPYQQEQNQPVTNNKNKSAQNLTNKSTSPGFYTLSKAKSLSHLFSGGGVEPHRATPELSTPAPPQFIFPSNGHTFTNTFANKFPAVLNSTQPPFFGSVRASANKNGLVGGPNAAYFGTVQRIVPPAALSHYPAYYPPSEIQEIKNFDSVDHDSRLKKYWENKITEL
ncbi:unnamed protein product [Orchesella dallaii]|uniref:PPM-type phosphatase domain-containing protein n=1 Tax=Orchesella dallaii TaxID=48710 RepID=A0ABP1PKC3_9HEXA